MHPILQKLRGGDRRSIGRANEVVGEVLADPGLFAALFSGLMSDEALIRMRSADAVEKITARRPEHLLPLRRKLLEEVARIDQKEVRWHVAQMLPRVAWRRSERREVLAVLTGYLSDSSSIVKTCAMQALADLAGQAPELRTEVLARLQESTRSGTPAMKARGRKLLKRLGVPSRPSAGPLARRRPG